MGVPSASDAVPGKKETTIRLKLPTKRLLDEVAFGGETYDETIRRLAGIVRNLSGGSPHLVKKGNTGIGLSRNIAILTKQSAHRLR